MAIYYWLGITGACGNVNNPENWTTWNPQGTCGFLPPASLTGPGFNDTVYFTKFTVSGACYGVSYYPQVAPQGQMLGRTGTFEGQNFLVAKVFDDCPVTLGTSDHYFKFQTASLELQVGENNSQLTNNSTSYIDVSKNSLSAFDYPNISINAGKTHTYWIKGQAKNLSAVTVSRSSRSIVHLKDIEFAVPTSAAISIYNISSALAYDVFYLYDTTTGYNGFYGKGNGTFNINSGYSQSLDTMIHGKLDSSANQSCTIQFLPSGYSGPSGPNELSRSYIQSLKLLGTKTSNNVYVSHGVDFVNLEIFGGSVNFNQSLDTNNTVVQKGFMYGQTSKITATTPTVTIGANGDFTIYDNNTAGTYVPDVVLNGNWNMDLIPGPQGLCGPN